MVTFHKYYISYISHKIFNLNIDNVPKYYILTIFGLTFGNSILIINVTLQNKCNTT